MLTTPSLELRILQDRYEQDHYWQKDCRYLKVASTMMNNEKNNSDNFHLKELFY